MVKGEKIMPEINNIFEDLDDSLPKTSNYLFNTKLDKGLIHYKDTEISKLDSGFCISRGYKTPTSALTVVEKCSEDTEYIGYIDSVRAREHKLSNGDTVYRVRIVCHLIIEDEIVEFYKELPATTSANSKLSVFLVSMGFPILSNMSHFELDSLKGKPIFATLQKTEKNDKFYYYAKDLRPRKV